MPFGMKNAPATFQRMVNILVREILRPHCRPRTRKTLRCKIQTTAKFPIPTSQKELARFLGMAGYYRNFCLNFSEIAVPLTNLLSKKVKFVWTDDCQLDFDKL